jgi:hypothetical protein
MNEAIGANKIDLANPANSRLYTKIKNDRHNCPPASCDTYAAEILAAITKFKDTSL